MMKTFLDRLSDEELADPRFTYRVAFVPWIANRASAADMAIEFVRPDSDQAAEIKRVLLKGVEPKKYKPAQIRAAMHAEGFPGSTWAIIPPSGMNSMRKTRRRASVSGCLMGSGIGMRTGSLGCGRTAKRTLIVTGRLSTAPI
jgi:hypothetical protein